MIRLQFGFGAVFARYRCHQGDDAAKIADRAGFTSIANLLSERCCLFAFSGAFLR
jgi:hypothetical protein